MSDFRKLPPVEPVEAPRRFSMTLLARDDNCPRSAYLAVKHKNGPGSHAMDRGTLAHAVFERLMVDLMRSGEPAIAPEDSGEAAALTAAVVDEVLRSRPDLVVPRREVDDVREMAFHWATAYDVDPEHIAGLERLMVLDLDCGWTVSGRLDLIALPSMELGQVDDYKSGQALPTAEEYEGSVQPWVYAALLCYGVLVDVRDCSECDAATVCAACGGRGVVEVRGEQIGRHLKGVLTREVYPKPRPRDDGLLHHREMLLSRTAIADFRADLERMAARLAERFASWEFPARSGSWCSTCPASHECPLPAALRDHAGTINSRAEAEEALELALLEKARVAAIEREVKNFAKAHDVALRVGDLEFRWQPKEGRAVRKAGQRSDWDGLQAAVVEAVEFGSPFDVSEWIVATVGNEWKKSKVVAERG